MSAYDQVSAAMTARENARKTASLNPFGSDRAYQCLACAAWPLGGVPGEMSPDDAIRLGVKIGSIVEAFDGTGQREGVCCGPSCVKRLNSDRAHNGQPQVTAEKPRQPPTEPARLLPIGGEQASYVSREDRIAKSVCSQCGAEHKLDQSRVPGGEWAPPVQATLVMMGWHMTPDGAKFCGKVCVQRAGRALPKDAPKDHKPVIDLGAVDVSYPAPQPKGPVIQALVGREVPEGRRTKGSRH